MDENSALIEQILREDEIERNGGSTTKHHNDGGDWQTVSYNKRNKKPSRLDNSAADHRPNGSATTSDVFRSIELHSEDRRRRAIEAKLAAGEDSGAVRSNRNSEKDGEYTDEAASAGEGGAAEASSREAKPKKPKKPKVTVTEAAAKIDAGYLGAFLVDITASYESQQDIQLMRFADFFGRAFASVTSSQFPWLKLFKESSVAKMVDIPLSHISEDVYKISADWLNKRSLDAIGSFMLWSLDNILADFASHRGPAKGTKKAAQQVPSKSQDNVKKHICTSEVQFREAVDMLEHVKKIIGGLAGTLEGSYQCLYLVVDLIDAKVHDVWPLGTNSPSGAHSDAEKTFDFFSLRVAYFTRLRFQVFRAAKIRKYPLVSLVAIFVVLAMALRCKPDVLISLLPIISENPKYQGQDKLPITVWMIAQASQGDLAVGLYLWIHVLLPMLSGKTSNNPQARDLNLQLVERILSSPKARPILINGAVRKGERLVPPSALKLLLSLTFPAPLAQLKATDRFAAVYPTLKEVALAGSPGSKAMKQVSQQMLDIAVKAAGEGVPDLSREASDIFIWCLTQNPECYKQWDIFYLDNLEASVLVLQKMSNEWNVHSVKHLTLDPVREALKSLRQKNEKELMKAEGTARHALLKDADKYCKVILGRLSGGHGCMKSVVLLSVSLAVGAAFMSKNLGSGDLQKLSAMFRSQ